MTKVLPSVSSTRVKRTLVNASRGTFRAQDPVRSQRVDELRPSWSTSSRISCRTRDIQQHTAECEISHHYRDFSALRDPVGLDQGSPGSRQS